MAKTTHTLPPKTSDLSHNCLGIGLSHIRVISNIKENTIYFTVIRNAMEIIIGDAVTKLTSVAIICDKKSFSQIDVNCALRNIWITVYIMDMQFHKRATRYFYDWWHVSILGLGTRTSFWWMALAGYKGTSGAPFANMVYLNPGIDG